MGNPSGGVSWCVHFQPLIVCGSGHSYGYGDWHSHRCNSVTCRAHKEASAGRLAVKLCANTICSCCHCAQSKCSVFRLTGAVRAYTSWCAGLVTILLQSHCCIRLGHSCGYTVSRHTDSISCKPCVGLVSGVQAEKEMVQSYPAELVCIHARLKLLCRLPNHKLRLAREVYSQLCMIAHPHTAMLVCLTSRLTRVRVSATVLAMEATVQWINLVFYLAPNVYVLRNPCNILTAPVYTSGFVQWSCWNTVSMLSVCPSVCLFVRPSVRAPMREPMREPVRHLILSLQH